MRTLKELLKLLLNYTFISHIGEYKGMCTLVSSMELYKVISSVEAGNLLQFITEKRPANHNYIGYGWAPRDWAPRKNWLQKQIEKL